MCCSVPTGMGGGDIDARQLRITAHSSVQATKSQVLDAVSQLG